MGTANIKDVAARAGVSVGTVSNVLNDSPRVAPESAKRVRAAIADLGYVRNDAARQLRAGRSNNVGLIVPDARNPFFADVALGAEEAASGRGLSVLTGNVDGNADREAMYLGLFEEQRAYGVLISPLRNVEPRLEALHDRGIPVVQVDRVARGERISSVSVDDVVGGRLAIEHLLGRGRRRIAFIGGPAGIRQVEDRHRGAVTGLAATPGARLERIDTGAQTVLEGRRAGERLRARPPRRRPDAVFAANDLLALGALQALVMAGDIRVPEDIAVIGYDDIDFAASAVVPLTSVRQPARTIGARALELLLTEGEDPGVGAQQIVYQPELVVRESS
ncbi:MAG: LacI family DNA-binding transcriptional regulator [Microbacteriaceae bacterium]|nr:LacI family DNA-binding transcriptional regulator [Microbacteriaceae bacterium]